MIEDRDNIRRRAAFTLAEMLIVLAILAVMTTIAVQSMGPVANQARYESTVKTLNSISAAIISTPNSSPSDAMPAVTGYIADTGHFPRLVYNSATNTYTNDLCYQPTDLSIPVFGDATSGGLLTNVPLPQLGNPANVTNFSWGWRGPYVQPPVGSNTLFDGWGGPILLDTIPAGTAVTLGAQTFASVSNNTLAIVSAGSPTSNYQHPIDALNSTTDIVVILPPTSWQASSVQGKLYSQDSSGNHNSPPKGTWAVTLFGAGPIGVSSYKATMTAGSTTVVGNVTTTASVDVSYQFTINDPTNPPWAGPHILYVTNNSGDSGLSTSGSPTYAIGRAVYLNIYPGATHSVDLRIQ